MAISFIENLKDLLSPRNEKSQQPFQEASQKASIKDAYQNVNTERRIMYSGICKSAAAGGYQLYVVTSENGSCYEMISRYGLEESEVKFKLDLVSSFTQKGGLGDTEVTDEQIISIVEMAVSRHPNLPEFISEYLNNILEKEEMDDEEDVIPAHAANCRTVLTNYLGHSQLGQNYFRKVIACYVNYMPRGGIDVTPSFINN